MKKFHTILWDLDGTLLDFLKSEKYAITHCFQKFGLEISDEILARYSKINDGFWKKLELGEITNKQEVLVGRFRTLFEEYQITGVEPERFQEEYKDALGSVYYYQDDSFELCKRLKKDYKQYLVTNGILYTQEKKLKLSGFDKIMDGIFISEQLGVPKPNKKFFALCFAQIPEFNIEKTIIVGDSLSSDIKGGINSNIATCWYNPEKKKNETDIKADYEIDNLQQLVSILEG